MANGSYVMALGVEMTKACLVGKLELRLLQISAEKTLKHALGSAQISVQTTKMNSLLNNVKKKLSDNPTSEEYRQNMAECESIENAYGQIIQNLRDQMEMAEEKLDLQQEGIEDRLKTVRGEYDQWRELANAKAESNSPFQG